jgi:hypothetical protein
MWHEGKVNGRVRRKAADIADCGLQIADLTAKNTAQPAAAKEWNHPDSELGDFTDREDFSTQSRQDAKTQSGKPFLLFAFPISAFVFAPSRLRAFAFKKGCIGAKIIMMPRQPCFFGLFFYIYMTNWRKSLSMNKLHIKSGLAN